MKPQIYSINKFFGGMSNDDYSGSAGMVFDAKNVDVGNSKGVILSRSGELFTSKQLINTRGFNGGIVGMITGGFPNFCALSRDGRLKFYGVSSDEISLQGILVGTSYRNIGVITTNTGTYGFILASNKILRWDYNAGNSILGVGASGVNITDHLTLSTGSFDQKSQYLIQGNFLFVSGGNKLYTINTESATWTEDNILQLDFGYSITYMSNIGDQIIIYASNGVHGKQYFWDGVSESYERYIDWYDKPILGGVSLNNIDYIVTGTNLKREFYLVNGYQPQIISETDVYTNRPTSEKYYFTPDFPNSFETIGRTIIMPGMSQIYKFGNSRVGLPNGFTRDFINSVWDSGNANITTLFYQDSFRPALHIFYTEGGNNYFCLNQLIGIQNSVRYPTNKPGTIKTLIQDMGVYSAKKEAIKIRCGFDLPILSTAGSTGINIYAKVNDKGNYADFYITTNYTTPPAIGDTYNFDNKTWTIYNITRKINRLNEEDKNGGLILHCTYEGEYDVTRSDSQYGTLTRTNGSGDATFPFTDADYGFKLIQKIDGNNEDDRSDGRKTFMCADVMDTYFNEIQFKFDLLSNTQSITPTLRDFNLVYNIIEDDL